MAAIFISSHYIRIRNPTRLHCISLANQKTFPTFADAIPININISFLPWKYFHERNIGNCLA